MFAAILQVIQSNLVVFVLVIVHVVVSLLLLVSNLLLLLLSNSVHVEDLFVAVFYVIEYSMG